MANLQVGRRFSSFVEFAIENVVKFSKRSSLKIESAVRAGKTTVELNPDLIYYEVKYACVRGGTFRVQLENAKTR
jgi:DNA-binding transcriptional regulator YdaS (Cro superfamily)